MKLTALERALGALGVAGAEALAADVARAAEIAGEAHDQARAIARGLFPVNIEPDGLMVALERLADGARETLGLDATFAFDATVNITVDTPVEDPAELSVWRATDGPFQQLFGASSATIAIGLTDRAGSFVAAVRSP